MPAAHARENLNDFLIIVVSLSQDIARRLPPTV